MIRAVIVDDELSALHSLKWEIEKFCPGIEVCDVFTNPLEAVSGINYLKPDCIFLDIEMPEMDGFQLLQKLTFRDFEIIFTTAYNNYAIKALKENAVDYLLKPIDSDDLRIAAEKVLQKKQQNLLGDQLKKIMFEIKNPYNARKISLSFIEKTLYVSGDEILYCKSDGNYTHIYFKARKKEVLSKKIKEVEALINNPGFFRTHHSYLVNLSCIKEFIKTDGQYLVLEDGSSIPVSRSKKNQLLQFLDS